MIINITLIALLKLTVLKNYAMILLIERKYIKDS